MVALRRPRWHLMPLGRGRPHHHREEPQGVDRRPSFRTPSWRRGDPGVRGRAYDPWIARMGSGSVKGVCDRVRWRRVLWRFCVSVLGSSSFARSGACAGSTSHSVVAFCDRTLIPLSAARAREGDPFFAPAFHAPSNPSVACPDRPRLISPRRMGSKRVRRGVRFGQAGVFMTAPSTTTPALVNFHSATNSLRASATISRLRAALPLMPGSR